jgi:hypothetical protein
LRAGSADCLLYLPEVQPWRGGRHKELLKDLLAERDRKLEAGVDPRMVRLLDPTIYAVAEVLGRIKQADGTAVDEPT